MVNCLVIVLSIKSLKELNFLNERNLEKKLQIFQWHTQAMSKK